MLLLDWKKDRMGVADKLRRSKGIALLAREGDEEVADRIVPSFRSVVQASIRAPVVWLGKREVEIKNVPQ